MKEQTHHARGRCRFRQNKHQGSLHTNIQCFAQDFAVDVNGGLAAALDSSRLEGRCSTERMSETAQPLHVQAPKEWPLRSALSVSSCLVTKTRSAAQIVIRRLRPSFVFGG